MIFYACRWQHRQNIRIVILSGWSTTRFETSKLKHVTLWKDHVTANSQSIQNCLSARPGVRPEHLWSRSLYVPIHHIISVISHFSTSSQWGFSQSFCIQFTKPRGGGWESIWASLLSVSCFICFFVLRKRRKNLSWMSCIETLALKLLQCSHSAPSIPRLNSLLSPDHWHDRNCGYHVTGSYCSLRGIRTSSHMLWTQYILTESPELCDHSDLAMQPLERICPPQHTIYIIQHPQNLNILPFCRTLLEETI